MTLSPRGYTARPHPTADQLQTLTVDATGGTYTLTVKVPGNATFTTAAIAFDALASAVKTSLNTALAGIGLAVNTATGGVGAAGGGTPYVLGFDSPVKVTSNATSLTGGASTAVIVETSEGIMEEPNATDLTLPATSLPAKVATSRPRVVGDRNFETIV